MSKHTETGMGKGNGPHSDKRTYPADELADMITTRITTGSLPALTPRTQIPVTDSDRQMLNRIARETAEEFNERIGMKLRAIGDKVLAKIEEKLDADQFKTSELAFVYSVAHDKRLSLDGSRALQNASVNIQVNNFGPNPKESLLNELEGLRNVTPPPPQKSSPEPKETTNTDQREAAPIPV